MKNNFINDSADYADFRDFIKNAVATDYADYVYFRDYMKKIFSPLTTLTTLIFKIT